MGENGLEDLTLLLHLCTDGITTVCFISCLGIEPTASFMRR